MSSVLTYNVKVQMSEEMFTYWQEMLSQAKACYNHCAVRVKELNLPFSLKIVHARLYDELRGMFPLIPSQGVIKMIQEVLMAYRSIRKNKHKDADTPVRKPLCMRLDKRLYSRFTSEGISLISAKKNNRERVTFELYPKIQEMFSQYTTCDPLLFIRDGIPYLSIPFNVPERPVLSEESIGVDLGERLLFVTSEGKTFRDKTYLRERRKIRYQKRQLQAKGTKSSKRKLKRLKHRERNLSKDMCIRACNALINSTDASVLVLEDLSGIKKSKKKEKKTYKEKKNETNHNRRLSQVPFYQFKEILTYKAALSGKKVITVSACYTSQEDCRTGRCDGQRFKRRYIASDGLVMDADFNAAVNIAKRGKHPFSMVVPKDGTITILRGRVPSTTRMSH